MATARLKTTGVNVRLAVAAALSKERRQALIAQHAREGLRESQEINRAALGRVPPHETFVDGRRGAREETINPDGGVILYRFQLITEVFEWIEAMLIMHSPVGKDGKEPTYAKSHTFFADGVEADPARPPQAEVFVFLSTVPYARKIEGVNGRRGQSSQAPDGVYEAVAAMAARRFGNVARIRFGFRSFGEGVLSSSRSISEIRKEHGRAAASAIAKSEDNRRQPAIIIAMG